jgi:hypothetical protein
MLKAKEAKEPARTAQETLHRAHHRLKPSRGRFRFWRAPAAPLVAILDGRAVNSSQTERLCMLGSSRISWTDPDALKA